VDIRVGCSGWQYASWRGRFYPATLKTAEWLEYYTTVFDTVELNNSFYRLPEKSTFQSWRARVPRRFAFAVKASRYLTHLKRLLTPGPPVRRLFSRVAGLGDRLGPVLYQLPGNFEIDVPRLRHLCRVLPRARGGRELLHAIEFRHPSWYCAEVFDLLSQQGVALCLHDKLGSAIDRPAVGPFVYVRFHGPSGMYHGGYSARTLERWAGSLVEQHAAGRRVFAYFNNDPDAQATRDAQALREKILKRLG